jgi:uncharacterized membrane protein SpoIIM required for sporulation
LIAPVISTHWLEKRKRYWSRLEGLLDQIAGEGFKSLARAQLQELGLLYRQIASDLAVVREDPASAHVAGYLNALLARAHNSIYSAERGSPSAVFHFFWKTYPGLFRQHAAYCLAAFLIFAGSAAVGVALTLQDPGFKVKILGPQMVDTIDRHEMWTHSIVAIKPVASSAIMTNNLSVAFTMFAAGIAGGIGTLYMLAFNGLLIGTIATACGLAGMSLPLWSFVAPHGVLELPAIFIAGAAGLRLAHGLIFPGFLPRPASIARAGADAVKLLLGCIPILVTAGVVEAFVSPTSLDVASKFGVAAALFALLLTYLFSTRSVSE